jgi:hypothetical protein
MKKSLSLAVIILGLVGISMLLAPQQASAATFNPSNIIDDGIFENSNSMNAAQINAFLNSFSGSCISPNSGFQAIDPTGYSPSNGYTYGGWTTAGQVISDAARTYGINPQVLLVTLQKEQGLVQGGGSICGSSDENQYAAAMGYACPDSGTRHSYFNVNLFERNGVMVTQTNPTCVASAAAAGFSQQVIRAAWLFRFGEQRSQGNVNWAVESGNWDNSDDPQSCYGGPMTQGTFARCPSGGAAFYDGYTTIDGTSVHMDDGATAALYWYTPHLSGGQSFFNLFSSWFGSTRYSQPIDSMFVVGNQTGKVYFISLDNNTRYYVPSWTTAQAYGLDHYQTMPIDDSVINNYSDGGTLKTLVFNNDEQKIYMVDNGIRYWFQQYCTQWGLDCLNQTPGDVTFMTSKYLDEAVGYAGTSRPLQFSNGVFYLMQSGTKEPFANYDNVVAAGYANSQAIQIVQTDLNASQPLGSLQISIPSFIQFGSSTNLLYFDGTNYRHVPSYAIYQAWNSQPIMHPPASTYNVSPPSLSSDLSVWATDGNNDYLIDGGRKINITTNPATWNPGSFQTFSNSVLNILPTVSQQPNVSINGGIYVVQSGTFRHVLTYDDYLWLGIRPSNTLLMTPGGPVPQGVDIIRDGAPFTVSNNAGLYLTNGSSSFHVPSLAIANDFGVDWANIRSGLNPNVLSTGYPSSRDLSRWVRPNGGSLAYVANDSLLNLNSSSTTNWGINLNTSSDVNVDSAVLFNLRGSQTLGRFVRDQTTGGVYYGSSGSYHYVTSYNSFVNLGGLNQPVINVYPDFFTGLSQGSDL